MIQLQEIRKNLPKNEDDFILLERKNQSYEFRIYS